MAILDLIQAAAVTQPGLFELFLDLTSVSKDSKSSEEQSTPRMKLGKYTCLREALRIIAEQTKGQECLLWDPQLPEAVLVGQHHS